MFAGSAIDLAPFSPQLSEMAGKKALGSPLSSIIHPRYATEASALRPIAAGTSGTNQATLLPRHERKTG